MSDNGFDFDKDSSREVKMEAVDCLKTLIKILLEGVPHNNLF